MSASIGAESIGDRLLGVVGADPVSTADIRRRLEVFGWDCALHSDEEVAKAHGHRTTPAPATMLVTWAMPAYWAPGNPSPWADGEPLLAASPAAQLCGPTQEVVATEIDTEYRTTVYPGDRIASQSVLAKITPARTRLGDGEFVVIETTYTNQSGDTVGVESMTVFRYERSEAQR